MLPFFEIIYSHTSIGKTTKSYNMLFLQIK